jgi:hypothetical protein
MVVARLLVNWQLNADMRSRYWDLKWMNRCMCLETTGICLLKCFCAELTAEEEVSSMRLPENSGMWCNVSHKFHAHSFRGELCGCSHQTSPRDDLSSVGEPVLESSSDARLVKYQLVVKINE